MRILLTGATGYLGGWIYSRLSTQHDVACTVRPGTGTTGLGEKIEWDLRDDLPSDLPDFDAVIHAAQSRQYTAFPDGAPDVYAVNCGSTARLLDFAARRAIKTFCHISSGSVYEPYTDGLNEDASLKPTSLNGASKLAAELLTRPYESELSISRLRLFFPYGPGQTQRMVPGLADRIRNGESVKLVGKNGLEFSPLFTSDIAEIVSQSVSESWTGTFNVAGPERIYLRQFVERMGHVLGHKPVFETVSGEPRSIVPPMDRLKNVFAANTMTDIATGLRRTFCLEGE